MRFTIDDLRMVSLLIDGGMVYEVERRRSIIILTSKSKSDFSVFGTGDGVIGFKADFEATPFLIGFFSALFSDLPEGADNNEQFSEFCWTGVHGGNPVLLPRPVRTALSLTGRSAIDPRQRPIPRRPGFMAHLAAGIRIRGG